jgi:dTDP-glucose 4,6-dehydratase
MNGARMNGAHPNDAHPNADGDRRPLRRAVVLGGAGFVGSHLCDALLDSGCAVLCVDNFSTGDAANVAHLRGRPDFALLEHDATLPLPSAREPEACDIVFHLASPASPHAYARLPIETLHAGSLGTEQGLLLAERHRARFVLASTSEVYGDPLVHPQAEEYAGNVNPIGPRSVYDEGKRYAEALTAAYRRSRGVDTAIARLFNCYGPRMRPDDGRMIPAFVCAALTGQPLVIRGSGRQTRSICYVTDTVAGLLALALGDESGPVNLGNPDELSVLDTARLIGDVVGTSVEFTFEPALPDDPQRRCPDIRRAIERLGWRPSIPLREGLSRTVAWFAEQHAEVDTEHRAEPPAEPCPDRRPIVSVG